MLKKLKKRLLEATETDEVEEIKKEMHIYEVDVNYAHYYPLNERYISLYPQRGKETEEEEGTKTTAPTKKPELWAEIERRMEEGTLKELRYGVREGHVPKIQTQTQKQKQNAAATNANATKPRLASETQQKKQKEQRLEPPKRVEREAPVQQLDYTLNRRERRKAGLKSGAIKPAKAAVKASVPAPADTVMEDAGNISDGGFFEE